MSEKNKTTLVQKKKKLTKHEKIALKLENKNKIGLNQFIKPALFLIIAIALEIVNYAILGLKISGTDSTQLFPTYVFFDFGFWILIAGLMLISSKNWLSNTLFYFFLLFQLVICAVNASLYKDFGYVFTWEMIELAIEGIDSFDMGFVDLKSAILYISLLAVFIALPLVIDKIFKNKKVVLTKISKPIFCLICFLCSFTIGLTSYTVQAVTLKTAKNQEYEAIESDKYLYQNMHLREEAFKKFGTWGFYLKNLYDLTFSRFENKNKDEVLAKIQESNVALNTNATLYGDNLIVIMMESYEWFAIDPYNTPNLWKLKTGETTGETAIPGGAVVFDNYCANNKTNVSEDLTILGYMPNINTYKVKGTDNLATAYSLPNLFKKQDYTANYFHNWEEAFYDRNTTNIYMGFEDIYSLEDFSSENKSNKFGDFNLESDFIDQMIDTMAPTDKKFMSFYTTVATHGVYTTTNSRFENHYTTYDNNLEAFVEWFEQNDYKYPSDEEYQKILRQYKCATMDTDVAVGKIFAHLEENNLLDNTTVVLYADHNSYFHDLTYKIKDVDKMDYSVKETNCIPLMIYSSKLQAETKSAFCNNYDLYPTICELFGLEYNTVFAQGNNMFTDDIKNSLHVSYLTGYYNEKCWSKNMVDIVKYEGTTDADVENFKKRVCEFYEKQKLLEAVYTCRWKVN